MITFWVTDQGGFGIRNYRSNRGLAIRDRFEVLRYEDIGREVVVPAGPQIFAALDQLSDSQREAVGHVWDAHALRAPHVPRLNDPRRALMRFDLLTRLHQEGLNTFRVYRTDGVDDVHRFPVFVRHIYRHDGPATRLIETRKDLLRVLRALRVRGRRLADHMIVEFSDASAPDGLFRKYAAFKVGSRIIPCHLFASRQWCVKSVQNELTKASTDEQLRYIDDNPHKAWLRRVFDTAGIDYGRVDYGIANGVPQAWEINLNPTIGRAAGQSRHSGLAPPLRKSLDECREIFHRQLMSAFVALDSGTTDGQVRATIGDLLVARLRADARLQRRRQRMAQWLTALYESPGLGRPVRAVYSLFPRR